MMHYKLKDEAIELKLERELETESYSKMARNREL